MLAFSLEFVNPPPPCLLSKKKKKKKKATLLFSNNTTYMMRSILLLSLLGVAWPLAQEGISSSSSRTWSSKSSLRPPLERFRELIEETSRVARETGPRATIQRTLEGQRALIETFVELRRELPVPPSLALVSSWITDASRASESERQGLFLSKVTNWAAEKNIDPILLPKFLRKLFERLGATYVKVGQFVASSPTLFPPEFVKEFEKCLDDAPVVEYSQIKKIIEADLKRPISEVFDFFSEVPLASASVAQVHAATYQGQDVVVKVRKPGVDLLLTADLGFLDVAGRVLEFLSPDLGRLSLSNSLEDLRVTMLEELDFKKERQNLKEYKSWLTTSQFSEVATCPVPFDAASSTRVLTMTRLRGVSITDLSDISLPASLIGNKTPDQLVATALDVWAASVLTGPFFHADVHAANLLALPDGRVGFIDFGIVGRIPPSIFDAVAQAAAAAAVRDFKTLALALRDVGASDDDVDLDSFALDLAKVFDALDNLQPTLQENRLEQSVVVAVDEAQVTDILLNLVTTAEKYGIKLPREFGLLLKQALYFDKFTKLLAPDLDMTDTISARSLQDATVRD